MDDYHSTTTQGDYIDELVELLKVHGLYGPPVKEFILRHTDTEYFGEIQSVLDIKALIDAGLV